MDFLDSQTLTLQMKGSNIAGALLLANNMAIGTVSCGIKVPNPDERYFLLTALNAFEQEIDDAGSSVDDGISRFRGMVYGTTGVVGASGGVPPGDVRRLYQSDTMTDELIKLRGVWAMANDSKLTKFPWALVEIEESKQWEASAFCETITCETIAKSNKKRYIRILTSRGSLYSTISHIPAITYDDNWNMIRFWDVGIKDHQEHMHLGDAGALVIDTIAGKILAYAIRITFPYFMGKRWPPSLRVIPLQPVISQLSEIFETNVEVFLDATAPSFPKVVGKDIFRELPADFRRLWPVERRDR
ncbi:hypothetical protein GGI35DRAFT_464945 [Trichoderma velutinum]